MKRLIAIFFLLIYTGTAVRLAINYHYCGGFLARTSILNFGGIVGCPCNPGDMPKDGCKDKLISFKTDNHRSAQQSIILPTPLPSAIVHPPTDQYNLFLLKSDSKIDRSFYYLKRPSLQPIYLLIGVFRI